MTWRFELIATQDRRLYSRILQTFENQLVNILAFAGRIDGESVRITCIFSSEKAKARRMEALLFRLQNIRNVLITEMNPERIAESIAAEEFQQSEYSDYSK